MNLKKTLLFLALTHSAFSHATYVFDDVQIDESLTVNGADIGVLFSGSNPGGFFSGYNSSISGGFSDVFGSYNSINSLENYVVLGRNLSVGGLSSEGEAGGVIIGVNSIISNAQKGSVFIGNYNIAGGRREQVIFGNHNNVDGRECSVFGNYNTLIGMDGGLVFGNNNSITSFSGSAVILGQGNAIPEGNTGYLIGENLTSAVSLTAAAPWTAFSSVVIGFNNNSLQNQAIWEQPEHELEAPLFIIGNGGGSIRSNALVMRRSGRTTISNRDYVAPTTGTPHPVQPETFVVEGATTLKGAVRIPPSGDLSMGDFTGGGAL